MVVNGPPTPPTPYRDGRDGRDGKALADIIPPDRRRERAIALVGTSMVVGVALWLLGGWAYAALMGSADGSIQVAVQTPGYVAGRMPRATLRGPGGVFVMPPPRRSVVNVWLQGCSDCMPAFDAMAQLESEGGLNVEGPVINVAYGEADQAWARRYGVATNLVFDPAGAGVVKPLGIGTFTTLVVDPDGAIIHRDRPDRPGYVARVRSAMHPSGASGLDSEAVQRVVATNRAAIKRTCWERAELRRMPTHVGVTVTLTIGTGGSVTQSASEGNDLAIANCIEMQARRWSCPSPATVTTVSIPFEFVQE